MNTYNVLGLEINWCYFVYRQPVNRSIWGSYAFNRKDSIVVLGAIADDELMETYHKRFDFETDFNLAVIEMVGTHIKDSHNFRIDASDIEEYNTEVIKFDVGDKSFCIIFDEDLEGVLWEDD